MNRSSVAIIFAVIYSAIAGVYFANTSTKLQGTIFLLPPLLATVMGLYAAGTYKLRNIHGKSMAFLAAGMAFFFIGETLFFMYQYVFHKMPFPSVADVFYLLAYPLILAGLMIEVKMHKPRLSEFNRTTTTVMGGILVALVAVVTYFGIYKAYDPDATFLANWIATSYGIADLIIIVPAMYVLKLAFDFKGGKLFNSWIMIFFAMLFMLSGDILFASYSTQYSDSIWPYTLIDLCWVASYLLFGYSFFYTASVLRELRQKLVKPKH